MGQHISSIALVVASYDEAIDFYVNVLGFDLLEDRRLSADKRWVRVAPSGRGLKGCSLLLAKASNEAQRRVIGCQTGGRVFLFLHTDDFERDFELYKSRGVRFCEDPRNEAYGRVVVFEDLYGNRWDLIEPNTAGGF